MLTTLQGLYLAALVAAVVWLAYLARLADSHD
jgi:hypothetical protein